MAKRNPGGRPKLDDEERRDTVRNFRTTAAESELLDQAAAAAGLKPGIWMREVLVRAARRRTR